MPPDDVAYACMTPAPCKQHVAPDICIRDKRESLRGGCEGAVAVDLRQLRTPCQDWFQSKPASLRQPRGMISAEMTPTVVDTARLRRGTASPPLVKSPEEALVPCVACVHCVDRKHVLTLQRIYGRPAWRFLSCTHRHTKDNNTHTAQCAPLGGMHPQFRRAMPSVL